MSSIQSLGISGIRGYSPDDFQKIQFLKPLTLIWGQNGSGKTTIIECLKFITTGALPPNSERGKSFIMDTKIAGKSEVIGDLRLILKIGDQPILVKRRMLLAAKGNTSKFESIEQILKTKGSKGQQVTINHQCAQIQKQVPMFLGISKAMLQNVVFCHQEESLWPFGDSAMLKNIFDDLFQTKKITKEMEKMWESHNKQQAQLKQLKAKLGYEKQFHDKALEERSRAFKEMDEILLKIMSIVEMKQKVSILKEKLKDTSKMSKQRDSLLLRQGRLINSIKSLETNIKTWRQNALRVEKSYYQKLKGKSSDAFNDDYLIGISRNKTMFLSDRRQFSEQQLAGVKFIEIESAEKGMDELEEKQSKYQQIIAKYKVAKDQYETMRAYKETTKREQEIRSQQQRVRSICPEMKMAGGIKTDEDFLRVLKQKLKETQQIMQGIEMNRIKLKEFEKGILPAVEFGFSQEQVQDINKQSKQLQAQMSSASFKLLKIFKDQYKPIAGGKSLTPAQIARGQSIINEVQSLTAIIESKQKQLETYQELTKSTDYIDRSHIEGKINYYKFGVIVKNQNMLHYCETKGQCQFCGQQMTKEDIEGAKKKVGVNRERAQKKVEELQRELEGAQVDPEAMVKKLKQQINKLQTKKHTIWLQAKSFQEQKAASLQTQTNLQLSKQLQKCNLSVDMLPKLSQIIQTQPEEYYKKVPIQQFVELSSQYQVKLARYRGVKQQASKIQNSKRQNEINKRKRQLAMKEKVQLQLAIKKAEDQTKGYEFLKNSQKKLQSLIRIQAKNKSKQNPTNREHKNPSNPELSSQENNGRSNLTAEDAEKQVQELYMILVKEKVKIEQLKIAIGFWTNSKLLYQEQKQLLQVESQLNVLGDELKASQQITSQYNSLHLEFTRQSQRYQPRIAAIFHVLQTPISSQYLQMLNKIRHLEASIDHIQQSYHMMEQSVSQYHAKKMEEINKYIYDLWRDIYHEYDIEYIEIEAKIQHGAKKKKQNYDYKILMKKKTNTINSGPDQDKVQMKGRCSTGQKVLASIVIRLALLQVFCGKTRILALDEPTTNLDQQHVYNLAKALLRLIQISGGQNLQLIIISHDKQFIQLLEQCTDYYYEVRRNQDQLSTIRKKQIKDITGSK